ncbi:uncharacterized protein LOC124350127 isoform X3 [Daphnia pulicaria]|uniref:uncharacterized protein LOC124350127 isoform X3 n=1 Tax=Daphnia pulicaria TaxID=35523 RepID=UPI001EEA65CD|nr:uncharacterized protein LOC124350127 isoform X3 [Daphnia pulicaria]
MGISNFPPHLILLVFPLILIIDTTKAVAIHHERTLVEERRRPDETASINWTELMANGELDQRAKRALFLNLVNAQQAKAEENIRRRKDFFKVLVAATSAASINERTDITNHSAQNDVE